MASPFKTASAQMGPKQGQSIQVNHVSHVSLANTFKNEKLKVFCLSFMVQWHSIHWTTAEPTRQNAMLASSSQPGVVSVVMLVLSVSLNYLAGWSWLTVHFI
jgi:hypothetical protein